MKKRVSDLKWLWGVFSLGAAGFIIDCISRLLINDSWTVWVRYGITAGVCTCLFLLAPVNENYRKAAYFRSGSFALALLNTFVLKNSAIYIVISALSILATYYVHAGHSRISTDTALSKRWMQLFYWDLLIAALKMLVSAIATALAIYLRINITAVMWLLFAGESVLDVIRLVYLHKTIRLLKAQEADLCKPKARTNRLLTIVFVFILSVTVLLWSVAFVAGLQSGDKLVHALTLAIDPIILIILLTQETLIYISIKYFLLAPAKTKAKTVLYAVLLGCMILLTISEFLYIYSYLL